MNHLDVLNFLDYLAVFKRIVSKDINLNCEEFIKRFIGIKKLLLTSIIQDIILNIKFIKTDTYKKPLINFNHI